MNKIWHAVVHGGKYKVQDNVTYCTLAQDFGTEHLLAPPAGTEAELQQSGKPLSAK